MRTHTHRHVPGAWPLAWPLAWAMAPGTGRKPGILGIDIAYLLSKISATSAKCNRSECTRGAGLLVKFSHGRWRLMPAIEWCVCRAGSNVHNARMSTLGALTCTHKYLLRPETPWENDIGLIKKLLQIFQVSLQRPLERPGASSSRIEASASRRGASASRNYKFLSNPCKSTGLACTSRRTAIQIPAREGH